MINPLKHVTIFLFFPEIIYSVPKKQTKQNKWYVQYQNQCIHYGNFFHYSVCVFLILFQHKHLTLQTLKRLTKKFHFPLNHLKIKLFQTLSFNGITTLHWKLESFSWRTDIRLPTSLQEVVKQTSLNNLGKFSCGVGCKNSFILQQDRNKPTTSCDAPVESIFWKHDKWDILPTG